jgi:hypothetical protein
MGVVLSRKPSVTNTEITLCQRHSAVMINAAVRDFEVLTAVLKIQVFGMLDHAD